MNQPPIDNNNFIVDTNENKLVEPTLNESTPNSVLTDYEISPSTEEVSNPPSEVPYEISPSLEPPSEVPYEISPSVEPQSEVPYEISPSVEPPSEFSPETQPITTVLPINNEVVNTETNTESKTKKNYDAFINNVNKTKNQFTHKRKEMMKWDDKKKQEWRTKLSNTLIDIIRKSKNNHTHKTHHTQLSRMRNEFNHYLNRLSSSKSSKKSRQEKKYNL